MGLFKLSQTSKGEWRVALISDDQKLSLRRSRLDEAFLALGLERWYCRWSRIVERLKSQKFLSKRRERHVIETNFELNESSNKIIRIFVT